MYKFPCYSGSFYFPQDTCLCITNNKKFNYTIYIHIFNLHISISLSSFSGFWLYWICLFLLLLRTCSSYSLFTVICIFPIFCAYSPVLLIPVHIPVKPVISMYLCMLSSSFSFSIIAFKFHPQSFPKSEQSHSLCFVLR